MPQLRFRSALFLVALSATLVSLSFVPYNLYPLGFLGLIPLFYAFEHFVPTKREMFYLWLCWIFLLNFIAYHWIMHTIAVYGMMPKFIAFPLFLLYSLGTGGKMLFFFIFLKWMHKRRDLVASRAKATLAVTAAIGICEILGWQLFPWYGGNIVSGDLYFAQNADLVGTRGLSLIWAALQYLLYLAGKDYFKPQIKSFWPVLKSSRPLHIFISAFVLLHIYGFFRVHTLREAEATAPKMQIGVPQGNVPLITHRQERPYIIQRMLEQTERLVADAARTGKPADLIVWPESSIPVMEFERSAELQMAIASLQKSTGTPIIINDILHDRQTNKDYSNMWHLDAFGRPLNNYQKNFLLPFGEFMPLGETFPSFKNLFPAVSDFSHGEKFSLFDIATRVGTARAMPLICYEIILPDYARAFDAKSDHAAQFIVNITNDAWFGESVESIQHMTLGVMRAIELRLPIVRATNSGISAYIASTGEVFGETKLFERVNQLYAVPAMPRTRTVFSILGNAPIYIFMLAVVFYFTALWLRMRKKPAP